MSGKSCDSSSSENLPLVDNTVVVAKVSGAPSTRVGGSFTIPSLLLTTFFTSPLRISILAAGTALEPCSSTTLRAVSAIAAAYPVQKRGYAKRKMPPKKVAEEKKVLLGRPGNNLKSGIVCRQSPRSKVWHR